MVNDVPVRKTGMLAASCSQDAQSRLVNKEATGRKKPQSKDIFNGIVASIFSLCQTPFHSSKFLWSGRSQQTVTNSSFVIKLKKK